MRITPWKHIIYVCRSSSSYFPLSFCWKTSPTPFTEFYSIIPRYLNYWMIMSVSGKDICWSIKRRIINTFNTKERIWTFRFKPIRTINRNPPFSSLDSNSEGFGRRRMKRFRENKRPLKFFRFSNIACILNKFIEILKKRGRKKREKKRN